MYTNDGVVDTSLHRCCTASPDGHERQRVRDWPAAARCRQAGRNTERSVSARPSTQVKRAILDAPKRHQRASSHSLVTAFPHSAPRDKCTSLGLRRAFPMTAH